MREGAARGCWTIFPGAQQVSKAGGPQALGCCQPSLSAKPSPDLEMGIHSALGQMSPERLPKPQLRSKSKGNGLQTKECCPPSRSRRIELPIFTAPWKEARTKARMRPPGLGETWQNQISDNRYSQEKNFMNLGSYIFPYLQKRQNHLLKCLFLWLAATSYWDARVIARPLFTKITYTLVSTLPLGNSPQRSLRDCLSGYNLQFGWYKNLYFFLWLTIHYFFVDTNKIAYLFSCLLAIWRSSFMKNLFCFLTHFFLLGCLYFLLFQSTCRSSLCILDVNPLSDICTVNVPCLFTLIMVSFEE